ncbi:MAG: cytochrome c3 family protein [Deltaproteobacteria bacterium]|nr:cytochrome c3 family protein [Deltaproteobacteria bacterium]
MNKKLLTLLTVVLSGFLFLSVGVLIAADAPDVVMLENKGYKKDKKGPVKFTHKKHNVDYKIACAECHHVYKGDKNVWKEGDKVEKCSACHNPTKKEGKVMKLQNAYHRNCKNCHKALEKEGKPTGPFKKCNDCHAKKK